MTFHVVSIFDQAGMSRGRAVSIFLPAAVISLIINFSASWASDRLPMKIFLVLMILSLLAGSFAVALLNDGGYFVLLIIGYGISGGLMNLINSLSWPRFFGIGHLGAVSGFAMGLMVAGSAAGPYLFSLSLKYTGGYAAASWFCFALGIAVLIVALLSRPPALRET
jgi:MFS family permease